ncbi:MAG: hypothetical protein JST86_13055 [Bacteroidetes bacterium]|nr:hypothetical protein [Bacteroidota bacterium]
MKKRKAVPLAFEVDKLINSIENTKSGDSFPTEVSLLTHSDVKLVTRKNNWQFNWAGELNIAAREVYKLTISNNPGIIQGIVSLEVKTDHVYMHLIESAPFNKGKDKIYIGVAGNLVAFACKLSFQRGGEGYVSFLSKTRLIKHYEKSLGAVHFGGHKMVITTEAALKLTNKYFK